jgi:hypothetical protein
MDGTKRPVFSEEAVYEPPAETPWYKTISRGRWIAIVICLVGTTAVVLAILGAMNRLSGDKSVNPIVCGPEEEQPD